MCVKRAKIAVCQVRALKHLALTLLTGVLVLHKHFKVQEIVATSYHIGRYDYVFKPFLDTFKLLYILKVRATS